MQIIKQFLVLASFSMLIFTSCQDDEPADPVIPNEEEVITTLNFTLTPNGGGTPVVLTFQDLDGDGGNAPTISTGTLDTNTVYNGSLDLLDEIKSPADSITKEVKEEALDHQFFFQTSISGLNIAYSDTDANGNPLGLATTVTTGAAGSGTVTITLRHEPDKNAAGVSTGDITNAGGETDIEVTFNVNVQ
jgi:hypothetical protein